MSKAFMPHFKTGKFYLFAHVVEQIPQHEKGKARNKVATLHSNGDVRYLLKRDYRVKRKWRNETIILWCVTIA